MGNIVGRKITVGAHKVEIVKEVGSGTVPTCSARKELIIYLSASVLGGFSYVFLVKEQSSGKHYALKRMLVSDEAAMRKIQNEVDLMVWSCVSSFSYGLLTSPCSGTFLHTRISFNTSTMQ